MNLRAMREVNTGFGDGLATAFEMVVTPAIMGFIGFLIDRKFGTGPWFMFGFGLFTFAYMLWKTFYVYSTQMDRHEADAPWARRARRGTDSTSDEADEATPMATPAAAPSGDAGVDLGSMWINQERPA